MIRGEDIIARGLVLAAFVVGGGGALVSLTKVSGASWMGAAITAWVAIGLLFLGFVISQLEIRGRA